MDSALTVCATVPQIVGEEWGFDLTGIGSLATIPDHPDYGVVALAGMVAIYSVAPLHREGFVEHAFYVRERQRPVAGRAWEAWLEDEWHNRKRRAGPNIPLQTSREVVQAVRWPGRNAQEDSWAARLVGGFLDGPFHDWWFGRDFVGKVVGLYLPET